MGAGTPAPPIKLLFGDMPTFHGPIDGRLDKSRFTAKYQSLDGEISEDFAAIVPLSVRDYDALERWPNGGRSLCLRPSLEAARLCGDKLALNRFMIDNGFGDMTPALRAPGAPYPYIWKQRRGYWGAQAHMVRGPADEENLDLTDPDWFAQAAVSGDVEYAAHVLRDRGRIWYAATVTYQMARPDGVKGVLDAPVTMSYQRGCAHLRRFAGLLEAIGFEGTACLDYKLVEGAPQLFEVNARFGASLANDINVYLDNYLVALAARRAAA